MAPELFLTSCQEVTICDVDKFGILKCQCWTCWDLTSNARVAERFSQQFVSSRPIHASSRCPEVAVALRNVGLFASSCRITRLTGNLKVLETQNPRTRAPGKRPLAEKVSGRAHPVRS
jgi:hypothetical protein